MHLAVRKEILSQRVTPSTISVLSTQSCNSPSDLQVFPKQYITFNPMQYVVMRRKAEEDVNLFSDNDEDAEVINPITPEQYQTLMEYLEEETNLLSCRYR